MWVKSRNFIVDTLINYAVKYLISMYNKYGREGIYKAMRRLWDKIDTLLEKYVGKEGSSDILKMIKDFFNEQEGQIDKEMKD